MSTAYVVDHPEIQQLNDLMKIIVLAKFDCHYGINCDACSKANIFGHRYKCAVCDEYDLCSDCFEDRKQTKNHKANHPLQVIRSPELFSKIGQLLKLGLASLQDHLSENSIEHQHSCKTCNGNQPIRGLMFICDDCRGYRLCYNCYKTGKVTETHDKNHCIIIRIIPEDFLIRRASITLKKKLGEGAFGQVFLCDINGGTAAIKFCKTKSLQTLSGRERKCLENEILIYQEFFCDYIMEIKGYGFGNDNMLFMVLEYLEEGNLHERIHGASYNDVSKRRRFFYCENIIRALFRMHKKGILHKDLKPDNMFLTDHDTVKLGDLGIAFSPDSTSTMLKGVSQIQYYPTESPNVYHPSHDIYAYGLIFNEIITGNRNLELTQADCKDPKKVPYFGPMISACLAASGRDRPTTQCVKQYMLKFDQHLAAEIKQSKIDYEKQTVEKRNEVFDKAYKTFVNRVKFVNETDKNYKDHQPDDQLENLLLKLLLLNAAGLADLNENSTHQIRSPRPNLQSQSSTESSTSSSSKANKNENESSSGCMIL